MVWQKILLNPKTAGNVIKKIFKGDKQKTTGTEVITKIKPTFNKDSAHKIELKKIPGRVANSWRGMQESADKTLTGWKRTNQKLRGEKSTKSGISKGKDLKD